MTLPVKVRTSRIDLYWGHTGIMEKKMETTVIGSIGVILGLYWGYTGMMEKKMETTIVYWGHIGFGGFVSMTTLRS